MQKLLNRKQYLYVFLTFFTLFWNGVGKKDITSGPFWQQTAGVVALICKSCSYESYYNTVITLNLHKISFTALNSFSKLTS